MTSYQRKPVHFRTKAEAAEAKQLSTVKRELAATAERLRGLRANDLPVPPVEEILAGLLGDIDADAQRTIREAVDTVGNMGVPIRAREEIINQAAQAACGAGARPSAEARTEEPLALAAQVAPNDWNRW